MNGVIHERVCELVELRHGKVVQRLGSGYFVRSDRILTASHVVAAIKALGVCWAGASKPIQARCAWRGNPRFLDIAVLEVKPRNALAGHDPLLALDRFEAGGEWEAAGFPEAADDLGGQAFGGPNFRCPLRGRQLQLHVVPAPDQPELWEGASGAAFFSEGQLVGVIDSRAKHFDGRLLVATPLFKVRDNADFLAALGPEAEPQRQRELWLGQVARLLGDNLDAARRIARLTQARTSSLAPLKPSEKTRLDTDALARKICLEVGAQDLFEIFRDAARELVPPEEQGPPRLTQGAFNELWALERVLAAVSPEAFSRHSGFRARIAPGRANPLAVQTAIAAELTLAAAEGRQHRLRLPRAFANFAGSELQLKMPPSVEKGIELGLEAKCWDFLKANIDFLSLDDHSKVPPSRPQNLDRLKPALEAFNSQVELLAGPSAPKPGRAFFFDGGGSRPPDRQFADLLSSEIRELLVTFSEGGNHAAERRLCAALQAFLFDLYRASKARRTRS